jgi:hypothetical protein
MTTAKKETGKFRNRGAAAAGRGVVVDVMFFGWAGVCAQRDSAAAGPRAA